MKHLSKDAMVNKGYSRAILFILLLSCFSWAACEKVVHINLKSGGQKLVVEGTIETGYPPIIRLSKSIGFFSNINLQTLSDAYVHNALVTVSDGQRSFNLKEYHYDTSGLSLYFYSVDSADPQTFTFLGQPGRSYSLSIQYEGKTYQSTTSIPFPKPLDSLWAITPPPEEMPENHPNSRILYAQYTDPDTPGNHVRYFTKVNQGPFLASLNSVYDDELVNGKTVQIPLLAGFQKMDTINAKTFGYFYKGDTVVVKWSAIDKGVFNFWQTLEYSYSASGNPFASPVEISTNISGGALGVWSGYGSSFDTLVISQ